MRRCLFSTLRNQQGWLLVGQRQVAEDAGPVALQQLEQNHYCAIADMEYFQRETLGPTRYIIHPYTPRKLVREVEIRWDSEDAEIIEKELLWQYRESSRRVYFVGGRVFNRGRHSIMLQEDRQEALDRVDALELPISEESKRVLRYHNGLPVDMFSRKIGENLEEARKLAEQTPEKTEREIALMALKEIADSPQPLMKESPRGRTDRVFGRGANLCRRRTRSVEK